jgi:hypothetical protein
VENAQTIARQQRDIRCDEQGLAEARLSIRRLNDLLRLHAGYWNGERSPGVLLSVCCFAKVACNRQLLALEASRAYDKNLPFSGAFQSSLMVVNA